MFFHVWQSLRLISEKVSSKNPLHRPSHLFIRYIYTGILIYETYKDTSKRIRKCFNIFLIVPLVPPWAIVYPAPEITVLEKGPLRIGSESQQNQSPGLPVPQAIPFPGERGSQAWESWASPGGLVTYSGPGPTLRGPGGARMSAPPAARSQGMPSC